MKTVNYSKKINAPASKVWEALWNDDNFKIWSSVFEEGSHAITDWQQGSKVIFLSAKGNGMYSTIVKKMDNEYMLFLHNGVMVNGEEKPLDPETLKWNGAREEYILSENNGETDLSVNVDIVEDYFDFFNESFPRVLEKIKELAEK